MREVDNSQDILDSRDIIKRIRELEDEKSDLETALEELKDELSGLDETEDAEEIAGIKSQIEAAEKALSDWDESEEGEDLKALTSLQDECEGYVPDWHHGATLFRDSYFDARWAQQEMEDLGYLSRDMPDIIRSNINFEGILEDLKQDYTEVDYDGVSYWVR